METQSISKNYQSYRKEQTVYVGLTTNDYHDNINGFLAIDQITRGISLNLFNTLKYNNNLKIIPGASKYVQISNSLNDFKNDQTILKLVLDSNFSILTYDYINENGKFIEDLLSEKVNQKISGIYPGIIKGYQKQIVKMDEANFYLLVKQIIEKISNIDKAYQINNNKALLDEKIEWEYAFDFCLAHISRFGVSQHYNTNSKRMEETDSFKAWYEWWSNYFIDIQEDNELSSLFYNQRRTCQDLSMFRPTGSFEKLENTKQKRKVIA